MTVLNVNMPHALRASDMPDAKTYTIVRADCEAFGVTRFHGKDPGTTYYIVTNRTHFVGGQKIVRTIADVRAVIARA